MLTGKTRYRTGWFGKLILQVEVRGKHSMFYWRDAKVEDLSLLLNIPAIYNFQR